VTLMDGLTFVGATGAGPCTRVATKVTCVTDEVSASPQWRITVGFADNLPLGSDYYVDAAVSSDEADTNLENNEIRYTVRVGREGDLTLTTVVPPKPVVPGQPVRFTVVVDYQGPRPIDKLVLMGSVSGLWYRGYGRIDNVPAECFADPGSMVCEIYTRIEPGKPVELHYVIPSWADEDTWGARDTFHLRTYDFGEMDEASASFRFAKKPAPGTSGTTAPPAGGDGDGGAGGGLPVTGSASLPVAATGLLLVLAGAGAFLAARRRRGPAAQ
jgi:hypothetical protein